MVKNLLTRVVLKGKKILQEWTLIRGSPTAHNHKEMNFERILTLEEEQILKTQKKYPQEFENALELSILFSEFIERINPRSAHIVHFVGYLFQARRDHTLALLSALRLHHVQGMMNLRHVFEAACNAAYALSHPNEEDPEPKTEEEWKKRMKEKYSWIQENFPKKSDWIKSTKEKINFSCAHSNPLTSFDSYKFEEEKFFFQFFNTETRLRTPGLLWMVGNIALGVMDLLCLVNVKAGVFTHDEKFVETLKRLETTNKEIKDRLLL